MNEDCARMFSGLSNNIDGYHGANLTHIDASHFDTSNVTSMLGMFATCPKLKSINVSNFNLPNANDMSIMFAGANLLESLDLSTWKNVNRVTSISRMFENLRNITTLDLSSFNTSRTSGMRAVFHQCTALTNIIYGENFVNTAIKNLTVDGDINQSYQMYYNCPANKPNWGSGTWTTEGTFLINDA